MNKESYHNSLFPGRYIDLCYQDMLEESRRADTENRKKKFEDMYGKTKGKMEKAFDKWIV